RDARSHHADGREPAVDAAFRRPHPRARAGQGHRAGHASRADGARRAPPSPGGAAGRGSRRTRAGRTSPAAGELGLTQAVVARHSEPAQRPLDFAIVRRLYACTLPYGRLRALLLLLVVLRSVQLPIIAWLTAWVISGPIAAHDTTGI